MLCQIRAPECLIYGQSHSVGVLVLALRSFSTSEVGGQVGDSLFQAYITWFLKENKKCRMKKNEVYDRSLVSSVKFC